MDNKELKVVILNAQNGDEKAMEKLLEKYKNMIKCYSFINGELREDLKQDMTYKLIYAIRRFKL